MPYKFFEDVAIADVAFEATGKTLEEMFISAGLALSNTQVKNLRTIKLKRDVKIKILAKDLQILLVNFLQEIIFYKDAKQILVGKIKIKIKEVSGKYRLEGKLIGEKIDMKKHELLVDVKAVSWHRLKVEKVKKEWKCFVILDV